MPENYFWHLSSVNIRFFKTFTWVFSLHTPLCCADWISLPALTVGCWGHRDLFGNSPHYKPHLQNTVKVYDIIHPCHWRALQSERNCMCYSDGEGNLSYAWFTRFSVYLHMWATLRHIGGKIMEYRSIKTIVLQRWSEHKWTLQRISTFCGRYFEQLRAELVEIYETNHFRGQHVKWAVTWDALKDLLFDIRLERKDSAQGCAPACVLSLRQRYIMWASVLLCVAAWEVTYHKRWPHSDTRCSSSVANELVSCPGAADFYIFKSNIQSCWK